MIYFILLGALISFGVLAWFAAKQLGRGWSFRLLFKDFNRKIWMTISLGFFFFTFYGIVVFFGASFVKPWSADLFFIAKKNPLIFIYGGLALFALLSLTIYFVRMCIKYFYLTRGKD